MPSNTPVTEADPTTIPHEGVAASCGACAAMRQVGYGISELLHAHRHGMIRALKEPSRAELYTENASLRARLTRLEAENSALRASVPPGGSV